MLVQALFTRGGGPIHHNIGGFAYSFKRNRHGDFVAPVFSADHREMMCRSGNFRIYEEPGADDAIEVPSSSAPEITDEPMDEDERDREDERKPRGKRRRGQE